MSNHIFTTKKDTRPEKFYCLKGSEDFLDDDGSPCVENERSPHVAAKKIQNKRPKHFDSDSQYYRYYIKCNPNNTLYNPIQLFSSVSNKKQSNFIDKICKSEWLFKEVDRTTFDKYIKFLSTQNTAWLKDAERDLR